MWRVLGYDDRNILRLKANDAENKGRLIMFLPVLPGSTFPSSTHFEEIFQSISDDLWEHDFILQSIMILSIVFYHIDGS